MQRFREIPKHIILLCLAALTLLPLVIVILTSLKDTNQVFHSFWALPSPIRWDNFSAAWKPVSRYILNTIIVTIASVAGILTAGSLAGYAFARHNFFGKTVMFYAIMSLMMIPGILSLVAAFVWVTQLHLLNTYWVLILPYVAGGQIVVIFIMRSTFANIPQDLFDAARIDGASERHCLFHIAMPLARPVLGTLAIMGALGPWNDIIWPILTINDPAKYTLAVGLRFFQGEYIINYGPLMAGYTLSAIPLLIFFLLTMRTFMRGITLGAIKT